MLIKFCHYISYAQFESKQSKLLEKFLEKFQNLLITFSILFQEIILFSYLLCGRNHAKLNVKAFHFTLTETWIFINLKL